MDGDEAAAAGSAIAIRVLGIPEILMTVLSFNRPKDAARCIRVCLAWYALATRCAWTKRRFLQAGI